MTEADTQGQEMVVNDKFTAMRSMINTLAIETELPDEEAASFDIAQIMENILSAETEEEVWSRQELGSLASKDYLNKPFTLKPENVVWRKSAPAYIQQGAFPFFALVTVQDAESGEDVVLNGGGASFVASLYRLIQLGGFNEFPDGRPLMLVGKPTLAGQEVVLLKPLSSAKRAPRAKQSK